MPEHFKLARPLAALAAALLLAACQAETAPAPRAERPVQVQSIAYQAEDAARDFVGVVRARYETDLGFRVGGKMVARLVNVGDRVRAGDVVARLDPEDLRLQVESAQAELAAATSNLTQISADFERYETLKARGFASVADFDRKTAAKGEAESRLARAKRSLDLARNQLDYSELKAGADGVITSTLAEPGQVVALGQPVVKLAHRGEKEAVVALPENWLAKASEAAASVTLWSGNGHHYSARLRELSPQADQATRTYAARFTILHSDDHSDGNVALGMTATVTLKPAGDAMVAKLPLSAVLSRGSGASVYVVNAGGELTLRPVTVASFNEDDALITGGVSAGEKVVTLGVQKLEPGLKVRSIEAK
ncbi:MAG: efflux RND transporter periplasmic adaptor subunit [Pseudolabrys sp.]